jgi:hypothetical protein
MEGPILCHFGDVRNIRYKSYSFTHNPPLPNLKMSSSQLLCQITSAESFIELFVSLGYSLNKNVNLADVDADAKYVYPRVNWYH